MILPLDLSIMIEPTDPVVTFNGLMREMDLKKYYQPVAEKGRIGYNPETMMKIVLFAQMENKRSLREIERACQTDIRFMWLAKEARPSHMTIGNFINKELKMNITEILRDLNNILTKKANIDVETVYLDGTKIEANANKYQWVWKKASEKQLRKLPTTISRNLTLLNEEYLSGSGAEFRIKERYEEKDLQAVIGWIIKEIERQEIKSVYGKGKHKSGLQRFLEHFESYLGKLRRYEEDIRICGEERNSYAKTDHDATYMRMKEDYMKNGQLKPGYNLQLAVSDGFIMAVGTFQNRDDHKTLAPMAEKLKSMYSMYPRNMVADAGYGSISNYIFCQDKNMRPFIKYTMYAKEKEKKYRDNPYRVEKMRQADGRYVCPQGYPFEFTTRRKHHAGDVEFFVEEYACEHCGNCPVKNQCTKAKVNRTISINELGRELELEAKNLLDSPEGITKRIQRSIQSEGVFAVIKEDLGYRRLERRMMKNVNLEFHLVAIGYNLFKYHQKIKPIIA